MAEASASTLEFTWRPARRGAFTPGRAAPVQSLMLHSSCGREKGDLAVLTGATERRVSAHWYVARSGRIYHLVADTDTAWHAGRVRRPQWSNAATVGIEMEHYDPGAGRPGGEDWPDAQVEACARLCAWLLSRHGLRSRQIVSHAEAADPPGRKADPWAFPWPEFRMRLAAARRAVRCGGRGQA